MKKELKKIAYCSNDKDELLESFRTGITIFNFCGFLFDVTAILSKLLIILKNDRSLYRGRQIMSNTIIFSNCQKLGSARGYNIVKNTTKLL